MKKFPNKYFACYGYPSDEYDITKISQVVDSLKKEIPVCADIDKPINSDIVTHKKLCDGLHATFCAKNSDYGNSFSKSVRKYGLTAALTRISDKFNRAENLLLTHDQQVEDESLQDTLLDLANYCIMTVIELNKK